MALFQEGGDGGVRVEPTPPAAPVTRMVVIRTADSARRSRTR
jgi:hypothetical protein